MPERLKNGPVALLVGYEDQENLGLRSIVATLKESGIKSEIVSFTPGDSSNILTAVERVNPDVIGFSVIFQYLLNDFSELMAVLRRNGINIHFTAGGHFPSLAPKKVLDKVPYLDSIVMFEGELTALELIQNLDKPEKWGAIEGLAYRFGRDIRINPPRPLITNLDTIPPPFRTEPYSLPNDIRVASLSASRGCYHNCSFCSIRQFYSGAPGPLRRTRSPSAVCEEMAELYNNHNVRFFIFQDDDFAAKTRENRRWIETFLRSLDETGLTGKIAWRIACRVDDVDTYVFSECRKRGLCMVYLGVESGSPEGLITLNKSVTVGQNLEAINKLKSIDLDFEIGFMLFDPDSTFETIRENIAFLREAFGDGSCVVPFCKMLPYTGTPIETRLRAEGRLKGTLSKPDYNFLDRNIDLYAFFVAKTFQLRNFDSLGLVERIRSVKAIHILAKVFDVLPLGREFDNRLKSITARVNAAALDTLERGLNVIEESASINIWNVWSILNWFSANEQQTELKLQQELDALLYAFNRDMLVTYKNEFDRRFDKHSYANTNLNAVL